MSKTGKTLGEGQLKRSGWGSDVQAVCCPPPLSMTKDTRPLLFLLRNNDRSINLQTTLKFE